MDFKTALLVSLNAIALLILGTVMVHLGDDGTVMETGTETFGGIIVLLGGIAMFCSMFCFMIAFLNRK